MTSNIIYCKNKILLCPAK